jgi:serine kinase of HPr protein (carbohydrate metabolism regulator)
MVMNHEHPIHASCVAIDGRGVLIRGASGAGKSDLALRLIDRGAVLVADDYVLLNQGQGALIASPPATIKAKMEVRGLGIITLPYCTGIPIHLCVDLVEEEERHPQNEETVEIRGQRVRRIHIAPHHLSSPIKVELALNALASFK